MGANVLIGGYTLGGYTPQRLIVRAIGPSVTAFGVSNEELTASLFEQMLVLDASAALLEKSNSLGPRWCVSFLLRTG